MDKKEAGDGSSGFWTLICVLAAFAGFFLFILAVFIIEAVKDIHSYPEARTELRGEKA